LAVGETGVGAVRVTPVVASVTAAVPPVVVLSVGRVGLAFVQAAVTVRSANALQIPIDFSFMCSYRA
jgi:hypothetical protein